jgi:hypothetical protein
VGLLAVLLVGGVIGARAITLTLLASHGAMTDLLPSSTVLYASVNLDPAGSQGDNLRSIERAFTSQPGWSHIQHTIDTSLQTSGQGKGEQFTWDSVSNVLDKRFAVAVTDASALVSSASDPRAMQNAVVAIVGLKVQASLADIVTSHHVGVPSRVATYHGVDLYHITSSLRGGGDAYGAILNGYAVIAATEAGVTREIDVQQGRLARLSDSPRFKQLAGKIAPDGPFFAYLDTPALLDTAEGRTLADVVSGVAASATRTELRTLRQHLGAAGLGLSAQPSGLDLQALAITADLPRGSGSETPNLAAQVVPAGTLAYLSFDNLAATYRTQVNQLLASGTLHRSDYDQIQHQVGDALGLLDGEIALGMLPTDFKALQGLSGNDTASLPLAVLIDVSKHPDAQAVVQRLLRRFYPNDPQPLGLRRGATARGNLLYSTSTGYGYALVKNWLVISPAIGRVGADLEGVLYGGQPSLAASDPFQQARSTVQGSQSMVMLVNLAAVRSDLESGLLPSVSPAERQQYQQDAQPWLAPLRLLAIRGGESSDGSSAGSELFVGIGP